MDGLEHHLQGQLDRSNRLFWYRLRWNAIRGYLPTHTPFVLVDIGAGAGFLGDLLHSDRPLGTYTFVEPIQSIRSHLAGQYGETADASGWADYRSADCITLLDVLEHQQDDRSFLQDTVTKMAPGARLILTVPARQYLWSSWDESLGHFRRYDKRMLMACVDGLSLHVDELSYLFPELVPFGLYRAHRHPAGTGQSHENEAELPSLPTLVNSALYGLGSASLALRRYWWTGSSLLLVGTRTAS